MRTLCHTAVLMISLGATLSLSQAQQADPGSPGDPTKCREGLNSFDDAVSDYKGAKFALDRAIQLLGSARFSSRVGKMNIDLASRQADANTAAISYAGSLGPAYGAVALLNASCSGDELKPAMRFLRKINADVSKLVSSSVDKLADDQMADIKKLFDAMKARQK